MSNWVLPWHYLATTRCLLADRTLYNSNGDKTDDLMAVLNSLSPAEIQTALAPNQPSTSDAEPPLFTYVRKVAQQATKDAYHWEDRWPKGLELRLRRMPFKRVIVGLKAVVFAWPLEGDGDGALARAVQGVHQYDAPSSGTGSRDDLDTATGFYVNAFMRAVDNAVDSNLRQSFWGATDKKTWLNDRAALEHGGPGAPTSLDLNFMPAASNYTSRFEGHDDHLTFHLGWLNERYGGGGFTEVGDNVGELHGEGEATGWNSIAEDDPASPQINEWPCGALRGFR